MANVAGGNGGAVTDGNSCDLRVRKSGRTPALLAIRADLGGVQCGRQVEREHSVPQVVDQQLIECREQGPLAAPFRPGLDPARFTLKTIFRRVARLKADPMAALPRSWARRRAAVRA